MSRLVFEVDNFRLGAVGHVEALAGGVGGQEIPAPLAANGDGGEHAVGRGSRRFGPGPRAAGSGQPTTPAGRQQADFSSVKKEEGEKDRRTYAAPAGLFGRYRLGGLGPQGNVNNQPHEQAKQDERRALRAKT